MRNPNRVVSIPRVGFAQSVVAKLRYNETRDWGTGAGPGTITWGVYAANGLYDPYISGVGHQPVGFDEYMLRYDHYMVIASKIKVEFIPNTGNTQHHVGFLGLRNNNSTTVITQDITVEQADMKSVVLTIPVGSKTYGVLTKGFSAKRFFKRSALNSDNTLRGNNTTNPGALAYYHVGVAPLDQGETGQIYNVRVTIDYIALFTEPKPLTGS